jgi:hypothetical protein
MAALVVSCATSVVAQPTDGFVVGFRRPMTAAPTTRWRCSVTVANAVVLVVSA